MSRKLMIFISGVVVTLFTILSEALKLKAVDPEYLTVALLGVGSFLFGKWTVDKTRTWTREGALKKLGDPTFWIAIIAVFSPFIALIKLPIAISIDPNMIAGALAALMGTFFKVEYNKIPAADKEKAAKAKRLRVNAVAELKAEKR